MNEYKDQMVTRDNIPNEFRKEYEKTTGYYNRLTSETDYKKAIDNIKMNDYAKIELLEHLIFGHRI